MRLSGWLIPLALVMTAPIVGTRPARAEAVSESAQQLGTVKGFSNGTLTIAPYNERSDLKEFKVDPSTPIQQGTGRITTAGLQSGTEVRIDYTLTPGQPAKATVVQVLGPEQVAAQKAQAKSAAPRMAQGTAPQQVLRPMPAAPAPTAALEPGRKEALMKDASGSQPGRIISAESGKLVLDPYQRAAGDATLQLTPDAVVFQANNKADTTALRPGTDVRVYYKSEGAAKPKVIAVELLDKNEAQKLEKAERDVPRGK